MGNYLRIIKELESIGWTSNMLILYRGFDNCSEHFTNLITRIQMYKYPNTTLFLLIFL